MDDITKQIEDARKAGYSDDEIGEHLSTHPVYGSKIQDALKEGYSHREILDHLSAPQDIAPNPNPPSPQLSMGEREQRILHGVAAGAIETGRNLTNVVGGAFGMPPIPPSNFETGTPGKIVATEHKGPEFEGGKLAERAGELMLPGGAINKGVTEAGNAVRSGGGAVKAIVELGTRGGLEGVNVYSNDRLHGATHEEAMHDAQIAGMVGAGLEGLGSVFKAVKPTTIYKSGSIISKLPEKVGLDQIDDIVSQAVNDKIPVTKNGLSKIGRLNDQTMAERNSFLAAHGNDPVDVNLITAPVGELYQKAATVGDKSLMKKITKLQDELLQRYGAAPATPGTQASTQTILGANGQPMVGPNGQPITKVVPGTPGTPAKQAQMTVAEAEKVKESFHELLKQYYEHMSASPTKNMIQSLETRGAREAIENIVPEVKELNKTYQNRKYLEGAITEYIKTKPGLLAHPVMLAGAIASDLGLIQTGFHTATTPAIAYEMLSNPRIRAVLALMKSGADASKVMGGIPQVAARSVPLFNSPVPSLDTSKVKIQQ